MWHLTRQREMKGEREKERGSRDLNTALYYISHLWEAHKNDGHIWGIFSIVDYWPVVGEAGVEKDLHTYLFSILIKTVSSAMWIIEPGVFIKLVDERARYAEKERIQMH